MVVIASSEEVDGRRLRREQNRAAVLESLVDLFREGNLQPSANEIAERAGLSPRSLFRYFDDIDDLNRAAIDQQLAQARPLLEVGASASESTETKVTAVVESRMKLFETIAPAARAARICAPRHALIAAQLAQGRTYLREQLRRLFATELAGTALLPALDALLSFETHELLRHDQRLSRPKTAAALISALAILLGGAE